MALPWLESLASEKPAAKDSTTPGLRMVQFYVPIGVVRRGFFPGEADHVIPKGNLGNVMKSLGKQDPKHSVQPLSELTPTIQPLNEFKQQINLIKVRGIWMILLIYLRDLNRCSSLLSSKMHKLRHLRKGNMVKRELMSNRQEWFSKLLPELKQLMPK